MRMALSLAWVMCAAAGCVHEGAGDLASANDYVADDPPRAALPTHDVVVPRDVVAEETPDVVVRAPDSAPPLRPHRDPIFFHLGAGYGALGQVDLGPCRG